LPATRDALHRRPLTAETSSRRQQLKEQLGGTIIEQLAGLFEEE